MVRDGVAKEYDSTGIPFGVLADFPYKSESLDLEPGDLMALFSDGIPEAQRGEEFFDEPRVNETLVEASRNSDITAVRAHVIGKIDEFLAGEHRTDDITLLMIRRNR